LVVADCPPRGVQFDIVEEMMDRRVFVDHFGKPRKSYEKFFYGSFLTRQWLDLIVAIKYATGHFHFQS